jgi:hypothetical protein
MSPEAQAAKDRRGGIPQMQHRHFAFIARMIAELNPDIRTQVARQFVKGLRLSNPQFSASRFYAASGLGQIELDRAAAEYEEILAIQNP